ncbi:MAG TPA: hypothetical protein VFW87_11495 [Pirellulales bacterium]|nr:hypothetical protein [Pirellulales bacterium]
MLDRFSRGMLIQREGRHIAISKGCLVHYSRLPAASTIYFLPLGGAAQWPVVNFGPLPTSRHSLITTKDAGEVTRLSSPRESLRFARRIEMQILNRRSAIWMMAAIGCVGIGLVLYSSSMPYYTDRDAALRLSAELKDAPREIRFKKWYARLPTYETRRKALSDWGRGCLAASAGLLCTVIVWSYYHSSRQMRTVRALLALWIGLWIIRIPLDNWYYQVRAERHDYPPWGDSIAIPLAGNAFVLMIGAAGSTVMILLFIAGRRLPDKICIGKPRSALGWMRAGLIFLWLGVLGWGVITGIPDGDESMIFSEIIASLVLLIVVGAKPAGSAGDSRPGHELCGPSQTE